MCHLVVLLPLLALPVFWALPLATALPLYLACVAAAGLLWWFITRSMRLPVVTGKQGLVGAAGEVVSCDAFHDGRCVVRTSGELWSARCDTGVRPGDSIIVRAVEGILLKVTPAETPVADTE